VGDTVGPHS
jgi:hypothetical protein